MLLLYDIYTHIYITEEGVRREPVGGGRRRILHFTSELNTHVNNIYCVSHLIRHVILWYVK